MFVIRNQSQIRIKNDPATPASNTNHRYHGVKRVPSAVHNSDRYSADVESRQQRLYNNKIAPMPVPVPNAQQQQQQVISQSITQSP